MLERITKNYHEYQANISNPSMEDVGKQYYDFMTHVESHKKRTKSFAWTDRIRIQAAVMTWKFSERLSSIAGTFKPSR